MNKKHLQNVYDTVNRIAANHKRKGLDRSAWFLTSDEFEEVKKDKSNTIL